jgi:hypothetical protein
MTNSHKQERKLFRAAARAALDVEAWLDDEIAWTTGSTTSALGRFNAALHEIACTTFVRRLDALKEG